MLLGGESRGAVVSDKFPRMTLKHTGEPDQPVGRELALAEFKVADLLVGRTDPSGKISQREAADLAPFLDPIRQRSPSPPLT